jgi:hypothetical protein
MKTVEATIFSECGRFKVEIERRSTGGLQVTTYKWTEEWVEGHGKIAEFWAPVDGTVTITDTLERAEQLARDKLPISG